MINLSKILKKVNYDNYCCNNSHIDDNDIAILAIFHLYHNKSINDDRFKAYCKQYKNDTIIRRVNTYHCEINDKWYNDTSTFEPILESYSEKCGNLELSTDDILKYLNKLLNMNKNFCIDHLYYKYYKPVIDYTLPNNIPSDNDLGLPSYEELDNRDILSNGYCCKDCDGCLGEYKRSQYLHYIGYDWKDKMKKNIKDKLNSMKTISAVKNPNNKMLIND